MTLLPSRNPFDTAIMPGKPLSERVSVPGGRTRSLSPSRRYDLDDASRRGIDRYVPGGRERSRSPGARRGGGGRGRRPGARREGAGNGNRDGRRGGERANPRPKKTQDELDAEMADYFGGNGAAAPAAADSAAAPTEAQPAAAAAAPQGDDIDMIE